MKGLGSFLRERKEEIVKKVRYNVKHEMRGYSECTQWEVTVSYDELEVVDFDLLMKQIEEFEKTFQK